MSDWMFDDGSASALLNQAYGAPGAGGWEPPPGSGWSQGPAYNQGTNAPTVVDPVNITGLIPVQNHTPFEGDTDGMTLTDVAFDPPDVMPCTQPPDGRAPQNVDMDELRQKAAEMGRELDRRTNADGNEWGALIFRNPDGSLGITAPQTIGEPGRIGYDPAIIPDGAVVVAEIHSHPRTNDADQGRLSEGDEEGRDTIIEHFNADPDFMTYVWDEEHDELHEFGSEDHADRSGIKIGECYG